MARVASKEVAGTQHRVAPRLRAAVLGPRGGGTTRRRASDAFRLAFASYPHWLSMVIPVAGISNGWAPLLGGLVPRRIRRVVWAG